MSNSKHPVGKIPEVNCSRFTIFLSLAAGRLTKKPPGPFAKLTANSSDAKPIILPGVSHFAPIQQPVFLNQAMLSFLDRLMPWWSPPGKQTWDLSRCMTGIRYEHPLLT